MVRRRRKRFNEHVEQDLEVLPLMNLFVVLIPMLLLSAVFLEITVIRMNLPSDDDSTDPSKREALALSVSILPGQWVVKGRALETLTIDRADVDAEASLGAALASIAVDHPDDHDVVIRSQDTTAYEAIVAVMDASREAGLENISLAGGAK